MFLILLNNAMTTPSLNELIAQRDALDKQIQETRVNQKQSAITQIHDLMAENELTQGDIFPKSASGKVSKAKKPTTKVLPKYRNSATGATWTGRGKSPKWLDGKDRASFLIA